MSACNVLRIGEGLDAVLCCECGERRMASSSGWFCQGGRSSMVVRDIPDPAAHITALEAQLAAADLLAGDICPVSDFVGLSGSDFAQSHPKLNAELDDGCREDWAEDLAWVIYAALAAYRAIRGGGNG